MRGGPYYNYSFGTMGRTLETARASGFFQWFHMQEAGRRPQDPGEELRFRPSGQKFRDLCYLDALASESGELVGMELTVQRSFLDGPDDLFAQDLVKSFLAGALPDACQEVLQDFMQEIKSPRGNGRTEGFLVFRGGKSSWKAKTGWSQLQLANVLVGETPHLLIRVTANPTAPNAKPVASQNQPEHD